MFEGRLVICAFSTNHSDELAKKMKRSIINNNNNIMPTVNRRRTTTKHQQDVYQAISVGCRKQQQACIWIVLGVISYSELRCAIIQHYFFFYDSLCVSKNPADLFERGAESLVPHLHISNDQSSPTRKVNRFLIFFFWREDEFLCEHRNAISIRATILCSICGRK